MWFIIVLFLYGIRYEIISLWWERERQRDSGRGEIMGKRVRERDRLIGGETERERESEGKRERLRGKERERERERERESLRGRERDSVEKRERESLRRRERVCWEERERERESRRETKIDMGREPGTERNALNLRQLLIDSIHMNYSFDCKRNFKNRCSTVLKGCLFNSFFHFFSTTKKSRLMCFFRWQAK